MVESALKRMADLRKPGKWLIAGLESVQESHGTGRFDPGWFHPSDFGNDCDAFLAFRFLGAPAVSSISAKTQRIFDLGSGRDEYLKRDMAASGLSVITAEEQRKIVIELYRIRGELDDLVKHPLTQQLYVVDFKTMHTEAFKLLEAAKPAHVLQVHPYMFAKQVYKAFILYENKDNQELKAFPADWDNNIWTDRIAGRAQRIISLLDQDVVNRNPVSCSRCPFFANAVCTKNNIRELKEQSGLYAAA